MKWRRWTGIVLLIVSIVAALAYGFWPKAVPVEAGEVRRGRLEVTVEEEGKTRVIDRYVVSAPVAGFARRVRWKVGDPVKRGEVIVRLEPMRSAVLDPRSRAEAQARVAAARAALRAAQENERAAETNDAYAQAELSRIQPLHASGFASQEALDRAEAEARRASAHHRSAEFAVEVAEHEVEAALTALRFSGAEGMDGPAEEVGIRSPVDGRILKILRESEGVVGAGEALIEIGDSQALEVEVDVLSADAVRIAPGTVVFFDRWGGAQPLEGRVRMVEPVGFTKISALGVEEQRVLVIADITSPPEEWSRLGDGYRVEARFILWEGEQVLQIPTSALFRVGEAWAVFVIEGGVARRRTVQIGQQSGRLAQVESGLQEGERVITHPDAAIEEGRRVRLRE